MIHYSIIGQSNSVFHGGYATRLFSRADVKLVKASRLGFCPSLLGPLFGTEELMAPAAFCIFDFSVIDQLLIKTRHTRFEDIETWMQWSCQQARRHGTQPIFLIIPPADHIDKDDAYFAFIREQCTRWGVFHLDVRDVYGKFFKGRQGLYADATHPGGDLSQRVCDILADFMVASPSIIYVEQDVTVPMLTMDVVNVQDRMVSDSKAVDYKNSLASFRGVEITPQSPLSVRTGPFEKLHGIVVNALNSRANATFGPAATSKNLHIRPFGITGGPEIRVVPFLARVANTEDTFEIRIDLDASVPGEISPGALNDRSCDPMVEISDLIVERGTSLVRYTTRIPADGRLNLMSYVD